MSGAGRRPEAPKGRPAGRVSSPLGASRTLDDGVASPSYRFGSLRGATGATVPRSPAERAGNTITMGHYQ
jgi:hypothetical protein